ncbi:hypothetical protein [uncultured Alistipes sp.]|uniref:energy transducer TonB n=1 Tax=uncultured Alistipes sp. TaxID=538949 RepID=UPI00261169B4|nr:hypothetical protein [uncultured Alistipes sp.]
MRLTDYIAGRRRGREARRIEREAMEDAFLRDALDGYDAVEDDHAVRIGRMRRRVAGAPWRLRSGLYRAAAAAFLLCAALGGYWLVRRSGEAWTEKRFAVNEPVPATVLSSGDSLRLAMGPEHEPETDGNRKKAGTAAEKSGRVASGHSAERRETEAAADSFEEIVAESPVAADVAERVESKGEPVLGEEVDKEAAAAEPVSAEAAEREEMREEHVESRRYAASGAVAANAKKMASVRGASVGKDDPAGEADRAEDAAVREAETAGSTGRVSSSVGRRNDTVRAAGVSGTNSSRKTVSGRQAASVVGAAPVRKAEADGVAAEILSSGDGVPRPRGGEADFVRYVAANRRYGADAESPRGQVVLRFEVGADGRPRQIEVVRGLNPAADAEAVRLLREGPLWTAGDSPVELAVRF